MPIDTSIPLQAQGSQLNPLQMALQAAQFRAYNANGLAAQQQLNANVATSRAYQQAVDPTTGQLDTNKLSAVLASDPDAAFNYGATMKSVMDARQAQQTYDKGSIDLNNSQRENYANGLKFFTQQFATVNPNDPNAAGKIMQIGADAVTNGHIAPAVYKAMVNEMPDDPTQWSQFLKQKLASFQDAGAQLGSITPKPTQVDTGGNLQYVDTNPVSNPSIVGTSINKSLDPATASSPVQVMGPGGTPGVVPRSDMWGGGSIQPPLPTAANPNGAGAAAPLPGGAGGAPQPGAPSRFVPTGMPAGAGTIADQGAARVGALQASAQQAPQLMKTYDLASQAVKGAIAQGKGSASIANASGVVQTVLGAMGQKPTGDSVKDYQLAVNYLNSATDQAAASLGLSGSDSRLAAAKAGQPDPNNMNLPALQEAIAHAKGLQQAVLDRQQATTSYLAQNGNGTANLPQFEAKWNKAFNPDVSYVRSLGNSDEQKAALSKMTTPQLQQWKKDYQAMKDLGAF